MGRKPKEGRRYGPTTGQKEEEADHRVEENGVGFVTPLVLRLNQNTKPYHEHHVYVLLHVVNEKLNFIALILELSSNLFLVQILSSTTQLTIVILIQLHLSLFHLLLDPRSTPSAHS